MRAWSCLLVVAALTGCVGHTIDAGTNDDAGANGAPTGSSSGFPAEVFAGYLDGFSFDSGSSAVVATLEFQGGMVTGTVFFGNGPPFPPPTNPNVGYPPGVDCPGCNNSNVSAYQSREDFAFTVLQGKVNGSHVTLQVNTKELFKKWCELQTMTYPWTGYPNGPFYGCLPQGTKTTGCSNDPPVNCMKVFLCTVVDVCTCTATSCSVPSTTGDIDFDFQRVGDTLNGTVVGLVDSVTKINVRLTRAD